MVLNGFRCARRLQNTIRIDLVTAGAGLTLSNIETSKHLNIHCFGNVNVLEMTFKIFHFVQGLHRTPLLVSSIIQKDICLNSSFGI